MTSTMPPMAPPPTVAPEPYGAAPKARPTGVTILAVVAYIAAALAVLGAIGMFLGGALVGSMFGRGGAAFGAAMGAFIGFFFLVGAAISGLTGYGMWNAKPWGRVLGIVWGALWVLGGLSSMAQRGFASGLVELALGGVILWYLFQPGVKRWFGAA